MDASVAALFDRSAAKFTVPACRHCGDPCHGHAVVTAHGHFCCSGCEAIFDLIAAHGLTRYYTCDVAPAGVSRQSGAFPADYEALDDPCVADRFVESAADGRVAARFAIPALHCASCVWLLERLWRFDSGIGRTEVDLVRRTIRVEFSLGRTTLRGVAEQLASLGYAPVIDGERPAGRMPAARRDLYLRIGVAGFAFGNVMLFSVPRYINGGPLDGGFQRLFDTLNILFALPVLTYSASPYFRSAWTAIRARTMTIDLPIAIGLLVLFGRSLADIMMGWGEGFLDSFAGLVFFLLIGRLFQQKAFDGIAFDRTMRSFMPLSVRVERGAASEMTPIERVRPGDVVVLRAHEIVPADALLLDDHAAIDYAFATGESAPVALARGDAVQAGGRVVGRATRFTIVREVSHSRLADLWNHPVFAEPKPHLLAGLSSRFGTWFTTAALVVAAAGALMWWPDARRAVEVGTAVLIVACPCALALAAPITLGTAMGRLGVAGCFLKQPAVALDLGRIDTIVFDKTGTLTVADANAALTLGNRLGESQWALVRRLAAESVHPVSRALAGHGRLTGVVTDIDDVAGQGVAGLVDGHRVVIGCAPFVQRRTGQPIADADFGTWAAVDDSAPDWIRMSHPDRPGVEAAIRTLASTAEVRLLSGDRPHEVDRWRRLFGAQLRFGQSPEDKLADVRARQAEGRRVLMIGDGLNDAGALAAADVGMALSDDTACLVPACDVVIGGDRLAALPGILRYARRARSVIVLCLAVSIAYNAIGLALALAGRLTPIATAILMPVSSLTVVGLSVGLMRRGPA